MDPQRWRMILPSPLGTLHVVSTAGGVAGVGFREPGATAPPRLAALEGAAVDEGDPHGLAPRLERWFRGDRDALDPVPLDLTGTRFQRDVWDALLALPVGTTCTYGELAQALGRPNGARAVGAAVGRNPAALLVPCHRVVGRGGALTGYAWGLGRKRWLLQLEGARAPARQVALFRRRAWGV